MNDVDEHDDDPDGVTLWSGRLRAWPVASGLNGDEDDTVRTRRPAPGRDTAGSSRAVELDASSPSLDDDVSPLDDDTAPSRRSTPPAGSERPPSEKTSTTSAPIDDGLSASVVDTSTIPRAGVEPRVSASVADTEAEARPRGIRPPAPVVDGEPPAEREARSPVALHRESYSPRVDEPARVARAAAGGAVRSGDAALVHPRRSAGRARLVVLTTAVLAVVVLAAVGVVLLLG